MSESEAYSLPTAQRCVQNPGQRLSSATRSPHLLSLKVPCVLCSRGLTPSPGQEGPDVTGILALKTLLHPIFPRAPASRLIFPLFFPKAPWTR